MSKQIIIDHQIRGSYPLKADVLAGFKEAVANNQTTLALEYLSFVIPELADRGAPDSSEVDVLKKRIAELEVKVEEMKSSLAPSRRVTKKAVDSDDE